MNLSPMVESPIAPKWIALLPRMSHIHTFHVLIYFLKNSRPLHFFFPFSTQRHVLVTWLDNNPGGTSTHFSADVGPGKCSMKRRNMPLHLQMIRHVLRVDLPRKMHWIEHQLPDQTWTSCRGVTFRRRMPDHPVFRVMYCTIKINSSRGVTRDPKFQFVNSSRELELHDIPQSFVNP
jgi:hypothetical protein